MPSKLGGILASGRPVVVSAELSSGLSRTVREAHAGVVVAPNDPAALADALASLSVCPDVRAVLGESGRAWARAHLDEEEILGRMEATLLEAQTGSARIQSPE
jgi:colanic acid biosynthesis glycosyl transferase WcaI